MDWKSVSVPQGSKLYRVHRFTYMHKGVNYILEIDEFPDGNCTGHGEHSTDRNFIIESVSSPSIKESLEALIEKIESRT